MMILDKFMIKCAKNFINKLFLTIDIYSWFAENLHMMQNEEPRIYRKD